MSQDDVKAAAAKLTPAQAVRCIQLLYFQADGCDFAGSRRWQDPDCGKDNGKGYDCPACAARKLLHELGLKTHDETVREQQEERARHEPPKKVKRGRRL
jgi:hypothetical protein